MTRRKPRGVNGVTKLTSGQPEPEFIPTTLPDGKAEIERTICRAAFRSLSENGWKAWPVGVEPRQLPENDFDFVFDSDLNPEYLDLAEVAPLAGVRGGYEGAPTTFPRGKLVDAILRLVADKGAHYGRDRRARVHLLLYITDFRFLVSDGVVALLKASLRREHFGFASVSYIAQMDPESGLLHVLYPAPGGVPYFSAHDERRMRAELVTNFDPRSWKYDPEKQGFFQELPKEDSARTV